MWFAWCLIRGNLVCGFVFVLGVDLVCVSLLVCVLLFCFLIRCLVVSVVSKAMLICGLVLCLVLAVSLLFCGLVGVQK